jgi:hypothetical protein
VPIAATFFLPDVDGVGATTLGFLPAIGWGVWMATTMWLWPMGRVDDLSEAGPKCPQCGYLLVGLRQTRCPECGHEPTLDQLWAATVEATI